jgi:hypothetical protein
MRALDCGAVSLGIGAARDDHVLCQHEKLASTSRYKGADISGRKQSRLRPTNAVSGFVGRYRGILVWMLGAYSLSTTAVRKEQIMAKAYAEAERKLLRKLGVHGAITFPFKALKDIDAYVELKERAFLLDVKNVSKANKLDFEIGPEYVKNTNYWPEPKPLNVLVRDEGWGISGVEDIAAFVMGDGHAVLVELKAWRKLWREGWESVYGNVDEDAERLDLLSKIQGLSDRDFGNIEDYKAGHFNAEELNNLKKYANFDDSVAVYDKFVALDGSVAAARSMEIDGYVHPAWESGYNRDTTPKWTWIASYKEETLKEKGLIFLRLDSLERQDWKTLDARLLLQYKWPSYEAWEDYVQDYVDGKAPKIKYARREPFEELPKEEHPKLPQEERKVVYFNAHGRTEKELDSLAWALRRAGLPALAELSDVLYKGAPKGLLPSDLRKLDALLPGPLKLNRPECLDAFAELLRKRHVIVAGDWLEPRGHAAWQHFLD